MTDKSLQAAVAANQYIASLGKYMITASELTDDGLTQLCDSFSHQNHKIKVLFFESIQERRNLPSVQHFIKNLNGAQFISG